MQERTKRASSVARFVCVEGANVRSRRPFCLHKSLPSSNFLSTSAITSNQFTTPYRSLQEQSDSSDTFVSTSAYHCSCAAHRKVGLHRRYKIAHRPRDKPNNPSEPTNSETDSTTWQQDHRTLASKPSSFTFRVKFVNQTFDPKGAVILTKLLPVRRPGRTREVRWRRSGQIHNRSRPDQDVLLRRSRG